MNCVRTSYNIYLLSCDHFIEQEQDCFLKTHEIDMCCVVVRKEKEKQNDKEFICITE